jgi:hypothetical protein
MPTRTTTTTTSPLSPEKKPLQKRSDVPSSAIDVNEILRLAREVDANAQEEPEEKENKKRGARKKKGTEPRAVLPDEPVLIITDPEFEAMIQWGVSTGVDVCIEKLDWSEPGKHWREKVSVMLSRLIQRVQPMANSWVTDLITLGGYTALWVVPNVSTGGRTSPAPHRDNGNRQDMEIKRTPQPGA